MENRLHPVQMVEDLRDALRQSALPYAARLADFHLLLFLSLVHNQILSPAPRTLHLELCALCYVS